MKVKRCKRCKRRLINQKSIKRGYGYVCFKKKIKEDQDRLVQMTIFDFLEGETY